MRLSKLLALTLAPAALLGCSRTVGFDGTPQQYETLPARTDVPTHLQGTVLEIVDVYGTEPQRIGGYGLVVNLDNTGRDDGIPTAVRTRIIETASRLGLLDSNQTDRFRELSPGQLLSDPRTAVVQVTAEVPALARPGDRADAYVSTLETNTTPSLARGTLWNTQLYQGRVDAGNPGDQVNQVGLARGPLLLNPVHAQKSPEEARLDPAATASLRSGVVPGGAKVEVDRPVILRVRKPERRMARLLEKRINLHFGQPVAAAQDAALVELRRPISGPYAEPGREGYERFLNVVLHLYLNSTEPSIAQARAEALAAAARDATMQPAQLQQIGYAFEGLGPSAVPVAVGLVNDPNPGADFHGAVAAARLEARLGVQRLLAIARDARHPYAVQAAIELGDLPATPELTREVRRLLDAGVAASPRVRIEAYRSLVRLGLDGSGIEERVVGDRFVLHLVPPRRNDRADA